ncbi:hypothetical protein COCSADRAFT_104667, partial [Bipolaris sorokiniana ND90Pr]
KIPYKVFFTRVLLANKIVILIKKPNLAYLKVYRCKAFAITNNTYKDKLRL